MKTLIAIAALLMLSCVSTAHAQREGGAYFGPFSRGDSSGGNFGPYYGPPAPQQQQQRIVRKKKINATSRWLMRQR
jgi:hypothetical protein